MTKSRKPLVLYVVDGWFPWRIACIKTCCSFINELSNRNTMFCVSGITNFSRLPRYVYSQLPPCRHLAITDSSKIPGESYRRLTEINSRYYGLALLRTYGHFIRSQRHNFIVFSLVIADTEQHLGIFAHISSLFFLLFETVFVFFGRFPLLLSINQNSFIFFS